MSTKLNDTQLVMLSAAAQRNDRCLAAPPSVTDGAARRMAHKLNHPTVKPTTLLEDALLDLTNRCDLVLDPFLGSGSTLIAAENTGRVCRGVEIDRLYVDVIVRRCEDASGDSAVLIETGESFRELRDVADRVDGDARIERPRFKLGVARQNLDHADADVLFEQVPGEAVPRRVRRHALVDLFPGANEAGSDRDLEGLGDPFLHRLDRFDHRLSRQGSKILELHRHRVGLPAGEFGLEGDQVGQRLHGERSLDEIEVGLGIRAPGFQRLCVDRDHAILRGGEGRRRSGGDRARALRVRPFGRN